MDDLSSDKTDCKLSDFESVHMGDVPEHIEEHGVSEIEKLYRNKLDDWKNVKIQIGVTGDSGVGKSSFINAIRGLRDGDEGAAKTGTVETTQEITAYNHPTNDKIKFCDLPGIGTLNYSDLETYCKVVGLENYDTFLIFCAGRFTQNDFMLAKKVRAMKKSFFFVRTKIDQDIPNERDKPDFNESATLSAIKRDCLKNLEALEVKSKDVFLISNKETTKWEFARLTGAILDGLPLRLKESLTLTLDLLTTQSKDILKRKADVLRGRIPMIATISCFGAAIPVPGLSLAADFILIKRELNLYKTHSGLPDKDSPEFQRMNSQHQKMVQAFCFLNAAAISSYMKAYAKSAVVEEASRYIPFVGSIIAGSISFASTYSFLHESLKQLEKTALEFLDDCNERVGKDVMKMEFNSSESAIMKSVKSLKSLSW